MMALMLKCIISVAGIVAINYTLQKLIPSKYKKEILKEDPNENIEYVKLGKWEKYAQAMYLFIFVPFCSFILFWCANFFISMYRSFENPLIIVGPDTYSVVLLPVFFLSLIVAGTISTSVSKKLFSLQGYEKLVNHMDSQSGVDSEKAYKVMAAIFIPLSLTVIFLLADTYLVLQSDKIIINEFFSLEEKKYNFTDIKSSKILYDPKVTRNLSPYYLEIIFKDGFVYQLRNDSVYKNLRLKQTQILSIIQNK